MKIETKRLILREYTEDDFQDLFELLSDPITMKYYPKPFVGYKMLQGFDFLKKFYNFAYSYRNYLY